MLSFLIAMSSAVTTQQWQCDGDFYLILNKRNPERTELYRIRQTDDGFKFTLLNMFEGRRLTGLSYHVLGQFLSF